MKVEVGNRVKAGGSGSGLTALSVPLVGGSRLGQIRAERHMGKALEFLVGWPVETTERKEETHA